MSKGGTIPPRPAVREVISDMALAHSYERESLLVPLRRHDIPLTDSAQGGSPLTHPCCPSL
jgi:hypothetical protein